MCVALAYRASCDSFCVRPGLVIALRQLTGHFFPGSRALLITQQDCNHSRGVLAKISSRYSSIPDYRTNLGEQRDQGVM
jgi:hypothetical protein